MNFLNFILLSPELFFVNFSLIFLWAGIYLRYKVKSSFYINFSWYVFFMVCLTIILFWNSVAIEWFILNNAVVSSNLAFFFKIFTLVSFLVVSLITKDNEKTLSFMYVDLEIQLVRLFIIMSSLFLIGLNDLVYLFFVIELYSLASYVLIGFRGKYFVFSSEAALKYFLIGTVFSIIMAYGISLIYFTTGLTNFSLLELYLSFMGNKVSFLNQNILICGTLCLLIGFFFKLASAPFHLWAPDIYDGAPTITMFFLMVIPKIGFFAALINLSFLWFLSANVVNILILSALMSILVGSLLGLFQKKVKRLLTYSMINNNGFFLLALAVGGSSGISILVFFLIIYTFSLVGLFGTLLSYRMHATLLSVKSLWSWTSLFFINKSQAVATMLLLFSSAGLPPLVGFISKFVVLLVLFTSYNNLYYAAVIVLLFASLSCFYYIRVVKVMAFSKRRIWTFLQPIPFAAAYLISFMVINLFILFLCSGTILNFVLLLTI